MLFVFYVFFLLTVDGHETWREHPASHHPDVHCNPHIEEICPSGHLCNAHVLTCHANVLGYLEYCVCPHHWHPKPVPEPVLRHPDVHCNPHIQDICPSGHVCDVHGLDCHVNDFGHLEYCVCPHHWHTEPVHTEPVHTEPVHTEHVHTEPVHTEPVHTEHVHTEPVHSEPVHRHPDVHCNPHIEDVCPSGHLCDAHVLNCYANIFGHLEYCVCPQHWHPEPVQPHPDVHCNPYIKDQVCPGGHLCNSHLLDCHVNDLGHLEYCICPIKRHPDVHCNPYIEDQVCPGGHLCNSHLLDCHVNHLGHLEYCICPHLEY